MSFEADLRTLGLLAAVAVLAGGGFVVGVRAWGRGGTVHDPVALRLSKVGLGLLATVYVLLVFGSSVRVNGAGLACPDWPLCFGQILPAMDFKVFLEWGHRLLAGLVSLAFVGLAWAIFRRPALWARARWLIAVGALALATQVVLGGLTVLELLAEWTVTSHLVGGNTFSLLVLLLALALREIALRPERAPVGLGVRVVGVVVAGLLLAQMVMGGLVASSHAGLACGTWPGCNGPVWFPTFSGVIGLQVTHRLLAYLLVGAALLAVAVTRGRGSTGRAAVGLAALVLLQAGLGVANVLWQMPVEITLLHSAGAAALVLLTTWFNHEAWRAPLQAPVTVAMGRPMEAR